MTPLPLRVVRCVKRQLRFLPEESLPDLTGSGALAMKIAIFLTCLYLVNIVMMNFLIAVMGDTFERVTWLQIF